jgi:hypothetical protein
MTASEYKQMRDEFLKATLELSDNKRIEYTEGNHMDNVLWNFESSAKDVNSTPMKVLIIFLNKHLSSLKSYFRTGKEFSESIEGRIMDIINYLLLLVAMIRSEREQSDLPEDRSIRSQ